jgi:hypothetical protein
MTNYIVARIHNARLGSVVGVETIDEGIELIRGYVRDHFNRELTDEENEVLLNEYEFYNDSDPDNIVTFSVGVVE